MTNSKGVLGAGALAYIPDDEAAAGASGEISSLTIIT